MMQLIRRANKYYVIVLNLPILYIFSPIPNSPANPNGIFRLVFVSESIVPNVS